MDEIQARRAQKIFARRQSANQRRQNAAAASIEAIEQALQRAARRGHPEVRGSGVLEVVPFVDDQPFVRGENRGFLPVVGCTPNGHVGH